jgi:polyadenylate-binding protein
VKILEHSTELEKKQAIGEILYPLVHQQLLHIPHTTGKVTGMLLEMDNNDILHLIESPYALKAKVSYTQLNNANQN